MIDLFSDAHFWTAVNWSLTLLIGSGGLGVALKFRSERNLLRAQATKAAAEAQEALARTEQTLTQSLSIGWSTLIDRLQADNKELRDSLDKLSREVKRLSLRVVGLESYIREHDLAVPAHEEEDE